MTEQTNTAIEKEVFAIRAAIIALASALEDRFEPGVFRERLEFLAEEALIHGPDQRLEHTSELLQTMAKNLYTRFPDKEVLKNQH